MELGGCIWGGVYEHHVCYLPEKDARVNTWRGLQGGFKNSPCERSMKKER